MKYCKKCDSIKEDSEFYVCKTRKDGMQIYCKDCISKEVKDNYKKNKTRLIKKQRKYNILNRYGITEIDYDKMFIQQKGRCAICCSDKSKRTNSKHLCIDHSHKTGKIRGLLCHDCNVILAKLNDDVDMCKKIISYLTS